MDGTLLSPVEVKTEKAAADAPVRFTCKNCNESFRWEKDLSRHRRLDCKKKPFGCPECGQLLSRRDSLRQHLQRHDGGKKFACQYCDKLFDQQQNLKVHLRIHSGEKPYKCPECGRQFNQSQNLTTHLRVHSGEKPYKCVECGASFRFCSGYKSHVARSHTSPKPRKRYTRKSQERKKQVHYVSVIAKASSSSTSSFGDQNGLTNSSSRTGSEATTSSGQSGVSASNLNRLTDFFPPKLKYKCRVCKVECFRQLEIMQHIVEAHDFAKYEVVAKEPDGVSTQEDVV